MKIYVKIIDTIVERMQQETNKDRIYAYLDVAQIIRDELAEEIERTTTDNRNDAWNDKDQ